MVNKILVFTALFFIASGIFDISMNACLLNVGLLNGLWEISVKESCLVWHLSWYFGWFCFLAIADYALSLEKQVKKEWWQK